MDELLLMWSSFVKRKFQSNIAILMLSFGHGIYGKFGGTS